MWAVPREHASSLEWSLNGRRAATCTYSDAVAATSYNRTRRHCLKTLAHASQRKVPPVLQTSNCINNHKSTWLDHRTQHGSPPFLPCHYSYECTIQQTHTAAAMSHPASLSHVGTGNGSIHSHTLLTPPLSPATSEDTPYKPHDDDQISLSMKRRHKARSRNRDRRRLNRACVSSSQLEASSDSIVFTSRQLGRSRSLPTLHISPSSPMLRSNTTTKLTGTDLRDPSKRRWTLPSKAQPTQGLAVRVLVEKRPAITTIGSPENPSPAMITLRRASTTRSPNRKMSLTFFPPPKFSRQKSGLITTFLQTITRTDDSGRQETGSDFKPSEVRRASVVSFKTGQPETSRNASAPPVFTKVAGMTPSLLQPVQAESEPAVRRCSTTFISSGSTYEVIWDENISSSGSDTGSLATIANSRRRSSAVDKLETQLFKAVAQSRRGSVDPQSLAENDVTTSRNGSFSSLLSSKLSRSFRHGQTALPRSRSQKSKCPFVKLPEEEISISEEPSTGSIEFFPPLRSRSTTAGSQQNPGLSDVATSEPQTSDLEV